MLKKVSNLTVKCERTLYLTEETFTIVLRQRMVPASVKYPSITHRQRIVCIHIPFSPKDAAGK
jgi:hypothetical protein